MRRQYQWRGDLYAITLERKGQLHAAVVDGKSYEFEILDSQPGMISLMFEGRPVTLHWAADGNGRWISMDGCTYYLEKPAARTRRRGEQDGGDSIRAPMPAQVRSVDVFVEDLVEKGQTLMVLEAMKMEIRVQSPRKGRVSRLLVAAGDTVNRDQVVAEIREVEEPA